MVKIIFENVNVILMKIFIVMHIIVVYYYHHHIQHHVPIIGFILCEIVFGEYVCVIGILNENENENEFELEFKNVANVNCDFYDYDLCNGYYPTPYPTQAPTTTPAATILFNGTDNGLRGIDILKGVDGVVWNEDNSDSEICNGMFVFVFFFLWQVQKLLLHNHSLFVVLKIFDRWWSSWSSWSSTRSRSNTYVILFCRYYPCTLCRLCFVFCFATCTACLCFCS